MRGALLTGKLIEYGPAPYHHDPHEPMSYFVKIETPRGDRVIWGIDLERAFKASLTRPQVGDTIGLRAVRQDAVKVKTAERNPEGQVTRVRDLETHRNRWIVEKVAFFEARAAAAQTLRDSTILPADKLGSEGDVPHVGDRFDCGTAWRSSVNCFRRNRRAHR
jgi:hypothetical protein